MNISIKSTMLTGLFLSSVLVCTVIARPAQAETNTMVFKSSHISDLQPGYKLNHGLPVNDDDDSNDSTSSNDGVQKFQNVGYIQLPDLQLSTGSTILTIWYPARQKNPGGTVEPYDTKILGYIEATGPTLLDIQVDSRHGALRNATVAKGKYPLIVVDHGGGSEPDGHLFGGAETNELLAKSGYIVVGYSRVAPDCSLYADDLKALIDYMTQDSIFSQSIKKNKVGVVGESNSGRGVLTLAGGNNDGFTGDERVKAIILDEPVSSCTNAEPNISEVSVPTLIFDGSDFPGLGDQTDLYNTLESSLPRYKATLNMPPHIGFSTGQSLLAEAARNTSLQFQLDNGTPQNELLEPLNASYNDIAYLTNDVAGEWSSFFWNFEEFINFPIGSNGHFCTRVGVNDPILSTDLDNDGFTDLPPLLPKSLTALPNEELIEIYSRIQRAFWDLHLKGKKHSAKQLRKRKVEKDPNVILFMTEGHNNDDSSS